MCWGTHPIIILVHGEWGQKGFAEMLMWSIKLSHQTSVHIGHLSPPVNKQKEKSQSLLWTTRLPSLAESLSLYFPGVGGIVLRGLVPEGGEGRGGLGF